MFNATPEVNKRNLKSKILATLKKVDVCPLDELERLFIAKDIFGNRVAEWMGNEGNVNCEDFLK